MKLPNADQATVDESKVVEYLLSTSHPEGQSKAAFFSMFGFRAHRWQTLARALCDHGSAGEVAEVSRSHYGTRYSVDGPIETPSGRKPRVRTVWIVDREPGAPRLVTAYPLRRRNAR